MVIHVAIGLSVARDTATVQLFDKVDECQGTSCQTPHSILPRSSSHIMKLDEEEVKIKPNDMGRGPWQHGMGSLTRSSSTWSKSCSVAADSPMAT